MNFPLFVALRIRLFLSITDFWLCQFRKILEFWPNFTLLTIPYEPGSCGIFCRQGAASQRSRKYDLVFYVLAQATPLGGRLRYKIFSIYARQNGGINHNNLKAFQEKALQFTKRPLICPEMDSQYYLGSHQTLCPGPATNSTCKWTFLAILLVLMRPIFLVFMPSIALVWRALMGLQGTLN